MSPTRKLLATTPAIAGVVMFAWALGNVGDLSGVCQSRTSGTSDWAALGVFLVVITSVVGATALVRRPSRSVALLGIILTLAAMVIAAEAGFVIALASVGCEGWGEGPGLTIALFAVPASLVGYVIGWILRRVDTRAPAG